jgi:hypothetical protein
MSYQLHCVALLIFLNKIQTQWLSCPAATSFPPSGVLAAEGAFSLKLIDKGVSKEGLAFMVLLQV